MLMIVWNAWFCWRSLNSISEEHSRLRSTLLQVEMDCAKSRPSGTCWAEYERATSAIRNPLIEFAGNLRTEQPVVVFTEFAVLELFPPVAVGLLWGILWSLRAAVAWMLRGFGIELAKPREPDGSVAVRERLRNAGEWIITPKNILALSVGIVAIAISYYFLVSLPASNRERLQFEKDTAAAAKAERDSQEQVAAQAAQGREMSLQQCSDEAETTYWSYVRLNGKEIPGKPPSVPT